VVSAQSWKEGLKIRQEDFLVESSISKTAEDAASAASSAISAGVESASLVVESVESPTGTPENGDDLDDDPYSTPSTSSGKARLSASSEAAFTPPVYTTEDLTPLQKSYDSVKAWLDEKLALQEKLGIGFITGHESDGANSADISTVVCMRASMVR
jgi:hypothetical protein